MVFHNEPELKRHSEKWKHTDNPVNKKFWTQWSSKEGHIDSDMKRPNTIDFLKKKKKKGATVNSTSHC